MSADGIRRKNQGLTDVRSGYVNAQSMTGTPLRRLEEKTRAFTRYDFGIKPDPWIPEADWNRIASRHFPGCDIFSLKEMTERSERYSDWRSLERVVTSTESSMHFFRDGPIWATAVTSFDEGIQRVCAVNQQRIEAGREKGFLNRWVVKGR